LITTTDLHLNITSTRSLLIFIVFVLIFITALNPITDPDVWWHLKTGQLIAQTHAIPHADVFSYTRLGREWVTHEWLSEVFIYAVFRLSGFGGLIVVFAALITASFWITYLRLQHRVNNALVAVLALVLGAAATTPIWTVRPQIFSLLFASIFLCVLDSYYYAKSTRAIWWLVPLTILWVNLHAGFLVGLALIGLTVVALALDAFLLASDYRETLRRRVPRLFGVLVCCGAAGCLNPNGIRLYWLPFETLRTQVFMRAIEEWRSPDFHQPAFLPVLLLLLATFSILALSNKRVRPGELLVLVVIAAAALRTGRNIAFFSLVATPLFAEHFEQWLESNRWTKWITSPAEVKPQKGSFAQVVLNSLIIVLALTISLLGIMRTADKQPQVEQQGFPSAAVSSMLAQRPPQPIYNDYEWGGYLIWTLYPNYLVYIDGRADPYGGQFLEEFMQVHDVKPGWQGVLEKHGIRTVFVRFDSPIASMLREKSEWKKVFEDKQAVIFVRQQ
jgi:hypothetical protein